MSFFDLNKTSDFDLPIESSMDLVILRFKTFFTQFNFILTTDNLKISFRKNISTWKQAGEDRSDSLSIFREGQISLSKINNTLNIKWLVKLNVLYFISLLAAICCGWLVSVFTDLILGYIVLISLVAMIIVTLIGILAIVVKINEINKTCLDNL